MTIAKYIYGTLIFLIIFQLAGYSQSLPVGTTAIEDYYRRAQLTGKSDTNVSFTVRPLFPGEITKGADPFYPDSVQPIPSRKHPLLDHRIMSSAEKMDWLQVPPAEDFGTQA